MTEPKARLPVDAAGAKPQSDDPVEMGSEMSFPASDPPASRRPAGMDAGLPHDKLEGHDESVVERRPGDEDPSVLRPTEPPPT
ncbi:MAG: hypothetical protein K2Q20_01015 [Phycisphaerales bacterium]|nr:hypothetical protein [Phycisphaerales bacterium]